MDMDANLLVVPKAKDAKELWADVRKAVRVLRPIVLFWIVDARRSKLVRFKRSSSAFIWSTDMDLAWSGFTTHGDNIDFEGVRSIDPFMLPNDVTTGLIQSESAICIWKYNKHPHELVPYHFTFDGDEDWVALVPPMHKNKFISWLQPGGRFGVCDVSCNECQIFPGYTVYVGCHA